MWSFFKGPRGPFRIKSIRELDPKFQPRWSKLETKLIACGFIVGGLTLLVASLLSWGWLFNLGSIAIFLVFIAASGVRWGSQALIFFGYWLPYLGVLGSRFERWLEKDLEWPR